MSSAIFAARSTNAIPSENFSNVYVFVRLSPRRDQPGRLPSARWISRSESFCCMDRFYSLMFKRAIVALSLTAAVAGAQSADTVTSSFGYWKRLGAGVATSILIHEAGHIGTAIASGAHPTFGFDKGRPTVYSGIDAD